ncbi:phospholipid carrier-dependent glycosyltransferase [Cohnella sp. CFH 77786]|uniref:phospholipid carrier-dependent glycosyltransferase n=1 Tax=Cohnella sp. CFH 77786 TaxID=2662265 RepID=UPI001C60A3F7|nr:phospholipid carrier-dependent glycosyltransferase [Cohnella sp. CFH 77786]MBW5447932.1 phospholipid carrier-dependent glycosyltransferase [Cohnella sp. CFH 77786]
MDLSNSVRSSPVSFGEGGETGRADRSWKPLDWFLVLLLTLTAAITSFWDLGDRTGAQTYWRPGASGEGFTVDFGKLRPVDRLNLYEGPGARGKTRIEWSADGRKWELYAEIEHKHNRVFTWKSEDKSVEARYMRFTTVSPGYTLYEAAFFTKGIASPPIPVAQVTDNGKTDPADEGTPNLVFDEQEYAPYRPDYRNSMYFDEIYHGRTAYEFVERMEPYENTHPPLGKVILELGIRLFGMTPYGWRFMAAVGGTLMVPVMYAAAKGMFGRTRYAFLAALLLVLEGFHFVHSRITNVDIFGVTFTIVMYYAMYRFGETAWRSGGFRRGLGWLALSGVFFGCAASVKWNYMYGGAGLAILFILGLARKIREARAEGSRRAARRTVLTLTAAAVFFIAVPASIYSASYIPFERATKAQDGLKDLWQYQINMYNYHKGVKEQHPYASKWYTWPLMLRPVWYYGGKDLAQGEAQSIAAIGNPLIWWGGLVAMLASWWIGWRRRDRVVLTIAVMYLSFYVPWMVAPRSITFLYHYFPMVPLLILSIVWMMRWWEERYRNGRRWTAAVVVIAAGLFVWFYPVLAGVTISRWWMNVFIRWLPSWGF